MNNKQFLTELSGRSGLTLPDAGKMADDLIGVMKGIWQEGDSVSLTGFGVLEVRKKNERVSVNPSTGVRMLIPPKLAISYKPSPLLKERLNSIDRNG
ncbi:MAG: HU family DNA-binding protein [Bacteroidaceae bacterium]|nr:HU family DNA-binding protein [Bacteroidaceae bacterium]